MLSTSQNIFIQFKTTRANFFLLIIFVYKIHKFKNNGFATHTNQNVNHFKMNVEFSVCNYIYKTVKDLFKIND